jgi:hypothetical protein
MFYATTSTSKLPESCGDLQPPYGIQLKDKEIFAMLNDICIANKQNASSMSCNMATVT